MSKKTPKLRKPKPSLHGSPDVTQRIVVSKKPKAPYVRPWYDSALAWTRDRLLEPSTWKGLIEVAGSAGAFATLGPGGAIGFKILAAALGGSGIVGIVTKEKTL